MTVHRLDTSDWDALERSIRTVVEEHGGTCALGCASMDDERLRDLNKIFAPHVSVVWVRPLPGETGPETLYFRKMRAVAAM